MAIDISKLSAKELEKLRLDIDGTIAERRQEEQKKVIDQIRRLLADNGMSWDDLPRSRGGASKGSKAPAKYRDPKNPSNTWTGRGRKPNWVVAHLDKGGKIEALKI